MKYYSPSCVLLCEKEYKKIENWLVVKVKSNYCKYLLKRATVSFEEVRASSFLVEEGTTGSNGLGLHGASLALLQVGAGSFLCQHWTSSLLLDGAARLLKIIVLF